MASTVNFANMTLSDVIYGKYDSYELGGLRERECESDDYVDVSVQFSEQHATLTYLRDSGSVPMIALQRMLALHGVNAMFPNEYGYRAWSRLTTLFASFLKSEADVDADRMDCYGAITSMVNRYRYSPFGCDIHKLVIERDPLNCVNYHSDCFFCVTTLLLDVVSQVHFADAPENTIINLDVIMDTCSKLTAFAFHMYALVQNFYVECNHKKCLDAIVCDATQMNKDIIDNCSRRQLSTSGSGIDSTLAIIDQLERVNCSLENSLYQREDYRSMAFTLERLAAFNFGTATKVMSALLALTIPSASLVMRTYRSGLNSVPRRKLVIRLPEKRASVDTIKDVLMAFPSIMLRIGVAGFRLRAFSSNDDNGFETRGDEVTFGSALEKQYLYRLYYDLCRANVRDTTVLYEPQIETRKHNIMEVAHQMAVNGAPVIQFDEDVYIKIVRLIELAIAENFPFTTIRFGNNNDTRTFMNLVRIPDLNDLKIFSPLYHISSHAGLNFIGKNVLIPYFNDNLLGSNMYVELDFIIRFTDHHGRTKTVILPRLEWEINGMEAKENVVSETREFLRHNDILERVKDSFSLTYQEWSRLRSRNKFMIKSMNCRSDC